jgi:hypothetical protein
MDAEKEIEHGKSNGFISIKGAFDTDDRFTDVFMQHKQGEGGQIYGSKSPAASYIQLALPLLIEQSEQVFVYPDDFPNRLLWTYHSESGRNINAAEGKMTITLSEDRASAKGNFSFISFEQYLFNGEFDLLRS